MSKCQFQAWAYIILNSFMKTVNERYALLPVSKDGMLNIGNETVEIGKYLPNGELIHEAYICTHCNGIIIVRWSRTKSRGGYEYYHHFPRERSFSPKVDLKVIPNKETQNDFQEAIDCYNSGFWKASMIMSRRTIEQQLLKGSENLKSGLGKRIDIANISDQLRKMFNIIRKYGNHGAHPDNRLYDENGQPIDRNKQKEIAKISLLFLDHFFSDQYEIPKQLGEQAKQLENKPD